MSIIFYWKKKYFENEYRKVLSNYELYTAHPPNGISVGDTMWTITKNEDEYVLVGKLIIEKTKREPSGHGDFCILGDKNKSVFYDLNDTKQKKFKSEIQGLFNWSNDEIGVYFRGKKHIRELTDFGHQEFEKFSKTLQTL